VVRSWVLGGLALVVVGCAQQPARAPAADPDLDATAAVPTAGVVERRVEYRELSPKQPLRIDNPYGDVRVRFGGYTQALEWRTVAQNMDATHKIAVEAQDGERLTLAARLPEGAVLVKGQRVEMTVYVPKDHDLEVVTELGLIDVRGLQGSLKARSADGDISFRGIVGLIDVQTGAGRIEGQLDPAPAGSRQRIATSTGNIQLGIVDGLNAELALSSSGVFATEFSVQIEQRMGQEPNKVGVAVIGKPEAGIEVVSKRGEIRLLRRVQFQPAEAAG